MAVTKTKNPHKIFAVFVEYPFLIEEQPGEHLQRHVQFAKQLLKEGSKRLNPLLEEFIELCTKCIEKKTML